jgi:hypothetical protein
MSFRFEKARNVFDAEIFGAIIDKEYFQYPSPYRASSNTQCCRNETL